MPPSRIAIGTKNRYARFHTLNRPSHAVMLSVMPGTRGIGNFRFFRTNNPRTDAEVHQYVLRYTHIVPAQPYYYTMRVHYAVCCHTQHGYTAIFGSSRPWASPQISSTVPILYDLRIPPYIAPHARESRTPALKVHLFRQQTKQRPYRHKICRVGTSNVHITPR